MTLQWRAQLKCALIRSIMCLYAAAPVCGSGVEEPSRQQKIIVSLTSYPKRFRYLHLTVKSLLLQTVFCTLETTREMCLFRKHSSV